MADKKIYLAKVKNPSQLKAIREKCIVPVGCVLVLVKLIIKVSIVFCPATMPRLPTGVPVILLS